MTVGLFRVILIDMTILRRALLALAVALALATPRLASAGTIHVSWGSVMPTGPSAYLWEYYITVSPGTQVSPSDSFTIYDVWGYLGFPAAPGPWLAVATPVGASAVDLTFSYAGVVPLSAGTYWPFTFGSSIGTIPIFPLNVPMNAWSRVGQWSAKGTRTEDGAPVFESGTLLVPAQVVTPEPATLLLLGTGLVSLGAFARRRWKRSSASPTPDTA